MNKGQEGFPSGAVVKNLHANVGDTRNVGLIPEWGRYHRVGNGNPLQYSLPGKSHGQRSLTGYSSWGHKELGMTKQLHFTSPHCFDYCRFVIYFKSKVCGDSNFVFLLKIAFTV